MTRNCVECLKEFETSDSRKKYCSEQCYYNYWHKSKKLAWKPRACKQCSAVFTTDARGKFCSTKCRWTYNNRAQKQHTCVCMHCGQSFISYYATSKYCSSSCQGRHLPVPLKTLVCVDCGSYFTFKGRTRKHRCTSCHSKWNVLRTTLHRAKRCPTMRVGVGSGGNQWGPSNHSWLTPEERILRNYKFPYRKRAIAFWGGSCVVTGCTATDVHVHHVDGDTWNIELRNLIPLCKCHHWTQHRKRGLSKAQRQELLFTIWPEGRIKIAELSGETGTPAIRTEGCPKDSQGQSILGEINQHEAATPQGENICRAAI